MADRSEFETHHGWGFSVKDQTLYRVDPDDVLPRERVDALYEQVAQEGFWRDAELLAQERGFKGVFSEGRMGGWLVVDPQPLDYIDGLELHNFKRKMAALQRECMEAMAYWRAEFLSEVAEAIRLELAEPAERAEWESRDVETVGCV